MKAHAHAYLERTARELSKALGRRVRPDDILEMLVEIAIEDEGLYDPDAGFILGVDVVAATQPERSSTSAQEPAGRSALLRRDGLR